MDPFLVFDAQKALPNRFGLVLAAAARARALRRGATPRLEGHAKDAAETALREVSDNALTPAEVMPFLPAVSTLSRALESIDPPAPRNLSRPASGAVH